MIKVIPKCLVCKTEKNVIMRIADIKNENIWFDITYCKKCYNVIECYFRGKILKDEH